MKWAVVCKLDQTYAYLSVEYGPSTVVHAQALLFDTEQEAERVRVVRHYDWLEPVEDEREFRSREDTWDVGD